MVVSELEARRRIGQQRFQPSLTVDQRQPAYVLAIEEQQIEQEEDQRAAAGVSGILDQVEGRPTIGQHTAQVAVEVRRSGR
jgi:hypothetical protein